MEPVKEKSSLRKESHERFEELAISFGLKNFELRRDGKQTRYVDGNVHRAFTMYMLGREDGRKLTGSHFVIGKVAYREGKKVVQFSNAPVAHTSKSLAKKEMKRLAEEAKGTPFILYASVSSAVVRDEESKPRPIGPKIDESIIDLKRPPYAWADDGFGNDVYVDMKRRTVIIKNIIDQ